MIQFGADFSTNGVPETGLSPIITIRDTSDGSVIINGAGMTEVGGGAYKYDFTNDTAKQYSIVMDGGVDTLDSRYMTAWSERAIAEAKTTEIKIQTDKLHFSGDNVKARVETIAAAAVDSIHDEVIEGTLTLRQIQMLMLSFIAGETTGGGTTSIIFKNQAGDKNRITMTVNPSGDRSAVVSDVT